MPDPIQLIPIDLIVPDALARDRASLDPAALEELVTSILNHGLRMPIEVYELPHPDETERYGLISGFRRLKAVRTLRDDWGVPNHDAIPAFVREPQSAAEAMQAMIEENAIRAEVSPWEQARVALDARDQHIFDTAEAAIDGLYKSLNRDKRKRLRAVAHLAEEIDGLLTAPETLSLRQLLRIAAAASRGYADLMRMALRESSNKDPDHQWRALLLPIIAECEDPRIRDPRPALGRNDRPRRIVIVPGQRAIRIRRERTRDGWCLHITGRDAAELLVNTVLEDIERALSPG